MKYSLYVYILTVALLISCEDEIVYSNPINVAEHFNESIKTGDTLLYKKVFDFSKEQALPKFLKESFFKASKLYNSKKLKLIKIDTTFSIVSGEGMKTLSLVYKDVKKDIYLVELPYRDNYEYLPPTDIFTNLSRACEDYQISDYIPTGIRFYEFTHSRKMSDPFTFYFPSVKIYNNTKHSIEYLKCRMIIKNYQGDILFSQTFVINEPISSYVLKITDLDGISIGVDLTKSTYEYDFEVLNVEPKPESYDCKALEYFSE
jgi:hypothetical protein